MLMKKIVALGLSMLIIGSAHAKWDTGTLNQLNENGELLFFLFDENEANKESGVQDLGIRYDTMRTEINNSSFTTTVLLNESVFSNFDDISDKSTLRWGVMGYSQGFFDADYGMMITTNKANPHAATEGRAGLIDDALSVQPAYRDKINIQDDTDLANNNAVYGTDANNRYIGAPGTLGRNVKQSQSYDTTAGINEELSFYHLYDDFTATGFSAKFAGKWILDLAARTLTYLGTSVVPNNDTDGDGIANSSDNCPNISNADQSNADSDANGNACDDNDDNDAFTDQQELNCGSDPVDAASVCIVIVDTDGDSVPNSSDNCPSIANSDQLNTDGDTQGNVCDDNDDNDANTDAEEAACGSDSFDAASVCPAEDDNTDTDTDGVVDLSDNCPFVANADQKDSDNDGEGNLCDATPYQLLTLTSSSAQDGSILETTETSGAGGKVDSKSTTMSLGDSAKKQESRIVLHFDTAQLPDNAVITKATLTIKKQSVKGNVSKLGNIIIDMSQKNFGSSAALAADDFKAKPGRASVATLKGVSSNYSVVLSNSALAYISKTKASQFRLRFTKDDNNNAIEDVVKFFSGNSSTSKPSLVVEYYVP